MKISQGLFIPVFEGHTTVVVCPRNEHCVMVRFTVFSFRTDLVVVFYQDTSFITLYFNGDVLPRVTGQSMFVEFKAAHDYLLLPSDNKHQGTLESYQNKPIFVNLFKHSIQVSQVSIVIVCLMFL